MEERSTGSGPRAWTCAAAAALCLLPLPAAADDPAPLEATRLADVGAVYSLTVSGDGKWIAAAGVGGLVRILDAATGAKVRDLKAGDDVYRIAFTGGPVANLLTVKFLGPPCVWNATSGAKRFDVRRPDRRSELSNDAALCAVASPPLGRSFHVLWMIDNVLHTYAADSGRDLGETSVAPDPARGMYRVPDVSIWSRIGASADGSTVALLGTRVGADSTTIRVLRRGESGLTVRTTFRLDDAASSSALGELGVSGDGEFIVISDRKDGAKAAGSADRLTGCSIAKGVRAWERAVAAPSLSWNAPVCGDLVAIPTRRGVELADVRTGVTQRRLALPRGEVARDLAFDPRGGRLFALGSDSALHVWDLAAPPAPPRPANRETDLTPLLWIDASPVSFAATADASMLAVGCEDGTVRVVDPAAKQEVRVLTGLEGPATGLVYLGGGTEWLAGISSGRAIVWNTETGQIRQQFTELPGKLGQGRPTAFAASPARPVLVLERRLQKPLVWSPDDEPREWGNCPFLDLGALSVSRDGTRLAAFDVVVPAADAARGYAVFDLATGKAVWSRHQTDGTLAASDQPDMAFDWRATGFTADGSRLLRVGNSVGPEPAAAWTGHVRCSDAATGAPRWAADLPGCAIFGIVVGPESRALLLTTTGPYDLDTRVGTAKPAPDLPASTIGASYAGKTGALYLLFRDGAVVRATR